MVLITAPSSPTLPLKLLILMVFPLLDGPLLLAPLAPYELPLDLSSVVSVPVFGRVSPIAGAVVTLSALDIAGYHFQIGALPVCVSSWCKL